MVCLQVEQRNGVIKMKEILKRNIWLTALALCCVTFLSYTAIQADSCIEIDSKSFKVGICQDSK